MAQFPISAIITAIDRASPVFNKLSKNIQKDQMDVKQKTQEAAQAFAMMGAVTTGVLAVSAKTAIDFESAFAGVVKTYESVTGRAEDTEKELDLINQRFRQMTKEIPVAYTELSSIGELAGQLGVRGVDNMSKFVDTVAKISVATNLSSEQAATDFARIANVMQEPLENVDRMGATIVDLGNNFATTETDISNFAQRIAGAGKIAGLATSDIFAIGTAMSSVGVEAEAGGTAVQKVLLSMNQAVVQGGADLATFAQTAGLSASEFSNAWEQDAGQAFAKFITGLGEQGDQAINTLSELGLEDQRLIRSFLSLANAGDLVNETLEKSSSAWEANTALTEEAEKRFATSASQLNLLKNQLTLVAATLGEKLLPIINQVVTALAPYAEKVAKFIEENPKLTIGILAVVSALGLIGGAVLILLPIITGLSAAMTLLSAVSLPVVGIVLAVVVAIGALIAIGYLLWKNWDLIVLKAQELWATLVATFNAIKETVITTLQNVVNFFATLPERLYNLAMQTAENAILGFVFLAGFLWVFIPQLVMFILEVIRRLPEIVPQLITMMSEKVIATWNSLKSSVITLTISAINSVLSFFSTLPTRVGSFVENTKQAVINKWNELKQALINGTQAMIDGAVNLFKSLPSRVLSAIGDLAGKVRDKIVGAFRSGVESAGKIKLDIKGFAYGGVVPGPVGKPQLAVVHGGEHIQSNSAESPRFTGNSGGGGSPLEIHIHTNLFTGSKTELRNIAEMLYSELVKVSSSQGKTVSQYLGG